MKQLALIAVIACSILIVGCGKQSKFEKTMEDYATKYYDAHLKGTEGVNTHQISIAKLKEAVSLGIDNFDMSKLDGCSDESTAKITSNDDRSIKEITFELNCK